jgi:hypothetical protein
LTRSKWTAVYTLSDRHPGKDHHATDTLPASFNTDRSPLSLTISNNFAQASGGGILIGPPAFATIDDSTIAWNSTPGGAGGIDNLGSTVIRNSTIADNSAADSYFGAEGGGIFNSGTLGLSNSTIADNSADGPSGAPGGLFNYPSTVARMYNVILAGNQAAQNPDLVGPVVSLGHNLVGNTQGGSGYDATDLLNVDPMRRCDADVGAPGR